MTWSSTGISCAGSASTSRRRRRARCWPARRRCWRRPETPARRPPATPPPTRRLPRSPAAWTTARRPPGSAAGFSATDRSTVRRPARALRPRRADHQRLSAGCGRRRPARADLADDRPDPALPERAGDGDPVVPIFHVVVAAAVVELDGIHAATVPDVGVYPHETFPRQLRGGPELAVEAHDRLDRPHDPVDRHHLLAGAAGDRHLAEHRQAVAGGPAGQPPGPPRHPRPAPGA